MWFLCAVLPISETWREIINSSEKNYWKSITMFQCIIQQRNGWIHVPNQEFRDVNPGNFEEMYFCFELKSPNELDHRMKLTWISSILSLNLIRLSWACSWMTNSWISFHSTPQKKMWIVMNTCQLVLALYNSFTRISIDFFVTSLSSKKYIYSSSSSSSWGVFSVFQ